MCAVSEPGNLILSVLSRVASFKLSYKSSYRDLYPLSCGVQEYALVGEWDSQRLADLLKNVL